MTEVQVRQGHAYLRPEWCVEIVPGPPLPLWRRVIGALEEFGWAILTALAPTLPVLGAAIGWAIARSLH